VSTSRHAWIDASAGVAGWIEFWLLRRGIGQRIGEVHVSKGLLPRLWLAAVVATGLALAAKHGALSIADGRVSVKWERLANGDGLANLTFVWTELGGPNVACEAPSGYGTSLIRGLVPHELGGSVNLVFAPDGVSCTIDIPLDQA